MRNPLSGVKNQQVIQMQASGPLPAMPTHAMLKQQEQAEAALAKVLEMNPTFSQAHLEQTYPGAILRFKKGFALAGLS